MDVLHTICEMFAAARDAVGGFIGDRSPLVRRSVVLDLIAEANALRHERDEAIDSVARANGIIARHERKDRAAEDTIERLRCKLSDASTLAAAQQSQMDRLGSDIAFEQGEVARLKRMISGARTALLDTSNA